MAGGEEEYDRAESKQYLTGLRFFSVAMTHKLRVLVGPIELKLI